MCDKPCQPAHVRIPKDWLIFPHSSCHDRMFGNTLGSFGRDSGSKITADSGSNVLMTFPPRFLGTVARNFVCKVAYNFFNPPSDMSRICWAYMGGIFKSREQYEQHFQTFFYLLCCVSQGPVSARPVTVCGPQDIVRQRGSGEIFENSAWVRRRMVKYWEPLTGPAREH